MHDIQNVIRQSIKAEMKAQGLNNNTLEGLSGISRATIGKFLSGKQGITLYTLMTLLNALGMRIVLQRMEE